MSNRETVYLTSHYLTVLVGEATNLCVDVKQGSGGQDVMGIPARPVLEKRNKRKVHNLSFKICW